MKKAKVKEIEISDRLYIKKQDVEDHDELIALFTYDNGEEFLSTISESETHYIVPANGYYKLEWESVVDNRTFEITDTDLSFSGTLRSRPVLF